jgi:Domain of unknown function (DUF4130
MIELFFDGTFTGWKHAARDALTREIDPAQSHWIDARDRQAELVLASDIKSPTLAQGKTPARFRVPCEFMSLAADVSYHRDDTRWSLLYRHLIVAAAAPFFVDRFAAMRWSIVTPDGCAHWDRAALTFTEGVDRSAAPAEGATEDLWRTYYASIFNPARVKIGAMTKEMPKRYWRNLPEAELIPQLLAASAPRTDAMVAASDARRETSADFSAARARSGATPAAPSSAKGPSVRALSWSASSPATRKIAWASLLSAPPDSFSTAP